MQPNILEMVINSKNVSNFIGTATTEQKNNALNFLAQILEEQKQIIFEKNSIDVQTAIDKHLDPAKIERLKISPTILTSMIKACKEIAALPDPVGSIEKGVARPSKIIVAKMRVPLGVIFIIYESRPNVTVDAAAMCIKSGNSIILRGGSEAIHSNRILTKCIKQALAKAKLPEDIVNLVPDQDHKIITQLLSLEQYIDLVIPRGGESLVRFTVENSKIPVLKHYKGVVHIYIDDLANQDYISNIVLNAKTQKPSACNSLECLLVHESIAQKILPNIFEDLQVAGVRVHCCEKSLPFAKNNALLATEKDFGKEFLSLDLSVKIVANMDEAIHHIQKYGSKHTECIITEHYTRAMTFLKCVDASAVLVNASTRFNDGGEFGLGAEMGISTSKIHAYGPMGICELTTEKFIVFGQGQVRQ